jgi:phage-related protein (TIGR01555 family)
MAQRKVKTADAALARTTRPVGVSDGLENVVAGLGTDRDKMSYSVYGMPRVLTRMELENAYRGSWLSKKIVNAVADDMTREWRHVVFDDDDGESQFAIEQAEKRFALKGKINESLRWARLYGGALLIIGTRDKDLSKPLNVQAIRKGDLRYLHVMDRWRVSPAGSLCMDLDSPNFGMPEYYMLAESSVRVHHSRVLRFNGQKLPYFAWRSNAMWDDSELQHVLDSLTNCDTATRGIATMLFEANVDVVKAEGLADVLARKDGEAILTKRFQIAGMLKSFNRMLLLDGTESYEKKSNSFANLDKIVQQFMVDVSGAADIPMTRLFGQAAGGLNATGDNDVRNYYDMVSGKQETEVRPQLEYLDEVLVRSTLGFMPDDYRFDFNSLWQVSDTEQATIEKTRAERDVAYLNAGVVTEGVVARDLKERGTYRNLTDEDVELAEELSKPMDNPSSVATAKPAEVDPAKTDNGDDQQEQE